MTVGIPRTGNEAPHMEKEIMPHREAKLSPNLIVGRVTNINTPKP